MTDDQWWWWWWLCNKKTKSNLVNDLTNLTIRYHHHHQYRVFVCLFVLNQSDISRLSETTAKKNWNSRFKFQLWKNKTKVFYWITLSASKSSSSFRMMMIIGSYVNLKPEQDKWIIIISFFSFIHKSLTHK